MRQWLGRHRRIHLHFTPTGSSWLNPINDVVAGYADLSGQRGGRTYDATVSARDIFGFCTRSEGEIERLAADYRRRRRLPTLADVQASQRRKIRKLVIEGLRDGRIAAPRGRPGAR